MPDGENSYQAVSLNRRNEIMTKCRHKMPFFLDNYHGLKITTIPEDEEQTVNPTPENEPQLVNPTHVHPTHVPPDPLPQPAEVQPVIQPLLGGPMTRSRTRNKVTNL